MANSSALTTMRVPSPRSRGEHLADAISAHLRERDLEPGDRVGTIDEIHADIGFGRPAVSEAVRLLRERGVLEIRPGRSGGVFIADQTPVVRLRHTLLAAAAGTAHEVREAIGVREALEEPLALAASAACTPAAARRLRAAATALGRCGGDFPKFLQQNWALHEIVAALSPNAMMSAIYTACLGYVRHSEAAYDAVEGIEAYMARRAQIHAELVEAIVAGDSERIRAAVTAHNADETYPGASRPI
jgi:DNA-binding FadR family transcriptional regulator